MPATTEDLAFWWDGLRQNVLLIQRCERCQVLRHPPQPLCPHCGSEDWTASVAAGAGTVHSFVVYHYPQLPEVRYPYCVGVVALTEGVRIVAPFLPNDGVGVTIGQSVRLAWSTTPGGTGWPVFLNGGDLE